MSRKRLAHWLIPLLALLFAIISVGLVQAAAGEPILTTTEERQLLMSPMPPSPPQFSQTIMPSTIGRGSTTRLTFRITGVGNVATELAFSNTLPAALTISHVPNALTTCTDGVVTAPAGGSTIALLTGRVGVGVTCHVSVNVTAAVAGAVINVSEDLTSSAGNSGTAAANLTVETTRPGFSKAFAPSTVLRGETATLTFTIDNTANSGLITLLGALFSDQLPTGLVVAAPANPTTTCGSGITVSAEPGTRTITANSAGAQQLAAGASCIVTVDVTATTVGTLINESAELTVYSNFFQSRPTGFAVAELEVTFQTLNLTKQFLNNPARPGETSTLRFTLENFDRGRTAQTIAFNDDIAATLAGMTVSGALPSNPCGVGSTLINNANTLELSGGTLLAGASCTFDVTLQVPAAAAIGEYDNVTGMISAELGGNNETFLGARATLFVRPLPLFSKQFSNPVGAGHTVTLEYTITNIHPISDATSLTFTENFPTILQNVSPAPSNGSCGATAFFIASATSISMDNGILAAGQSCTFTLTLQAAVDAPSSIIPTATEPLAATVAGVVYLGDVAAADLTIIGAPHLTKTFTDDPVLPGETVTLEFTVSHESELSFNTAEALTFTDDLSATLAGLTALGLPQSDVCGTGSTLSGSVGDTLLTLQAGVLPSGQSCTFSVTLQLPAAANPGSYPNTTSTIGATIDGFSLLGPAASDALQVGGLALTKQFLQNPVIADELTTLRFTLDNTSTFTATGLLFTDNLNQMLTGLLAEAPLPATPCGAGSQITGTNLLIFSGGSLAAGASCSFDVLVHVPAGTADDSYNNTTSELNATLNGANLQLPPATDQLVVNSSHLLFAKSFMPTTVMAGDTTTLAFTITNIHPSSTVTNITFTDDLAAVLTGLAAVGLPANAICGAGAQLSGTGLLAFTGGSLAAGASCTFTATVQTPVSVPVSQVENVTSDLSGEIGALVVRGDAARAVLGISSAEISKRFIGNSLNLGDSVQLEFTLTNLSTTASLSNLSFSDDLDTMLSGTIALDTPQDNICGLGSQLVGTSQLRLHNGTLAPSASCTFTATLQLPATVANFDTITNTTSSLTAGGDVVALPAVAPLLVNEPTCWATPDDGVTVFASADAAAVQAAVDSAPVDGTVRIAGTCVGTQNRIGSDQTAIITQSVALIGGYDGVDWSVSAPDTFTTTLDANANGHILLISDTITVSVTSLLLQNGDATGQLFSEGGGIHVISSTLTISNTVIQHNYANTTGGGIYNTGGALTINHSTIYSNSVRSGGGGIHNNTGTLAIANSQINNNLSQRGSGGGIRNNAGFVTINASEISTNTVVTNGQNGGGLYNRNGTLIINDSQINNNSAPSTGGIFSIGSSSIEALLTIHRSTISNNRGNVGGIYNFNGNSNSAHITESTIADNVGSYVGGILNKANMLIENSTISGNTNSLGLRSGSSPRGGGPTVGGILNYGAITITHSTIAENKAYDNGCCASEFIGGITQGSGTMVISNTLVAHNQAFHATFATFDGCMVGGGLFTAASDNIADDLNCSGFSIVGDVRIGSLADNGGTTQTHALRLNSPAIDTAVDCAVATDQRGAARPNGNACDVGAYELAQAALTLSKSVSDSTIWAGSDLTYTITVENNGLLTATGIIISDTLLGGNHSISSVTLEPTQSGATLSTTAPILASGLIISPSERITLTVVVTTNSNYSGTITNTAIISTAITPVVQSAAISQTVTTTAYTVAYQIGNTVVAEGDSGSQNMTFLITRTAVPLASSVMITTTGNTATAGDDFTALNGQVILFSADEVSQTVHVAVAGDVTVELDETLTATLTAVVVGAVTVNAAVGTITNDDAAIITLSGGIAQNEGDTGSTREFVFTTTVDVAVAGGFSLAYRSDDGTATVGSDYVDNDSTLSFAGMANETQLITVTVNGDNAVEPNETFSVTLGAISGTALSATISTGGSPQVGTIVNDDVDLAIAAVDADKAEGDSGTTAFTFVVSRTTSMETNAVDYAVSGADSADFHTTTGTLNFAMGEMTQTLTISVTGDTTVEADEPFTVTLSSPVRSSEIVTATALGVIRNDDTATLSIGDISVDETAGMATLTVTQALQSVFTTTASFATSDNNALAGADYTAASGLITITAFTTQTTLSVPITNDLLNEHSETFTVTLAGASIGLADASAVVTILDDDAQPTIAADNQTVAEAVGNVVIMFTLSAESSLPVGFDYATVDNSASAPSDYISSTGRLTFTAGMTQTTLMLTITDDIIQETNLETFFVNLSNPSDAQTRAGNELVYLRTSQVTVTIDDNDLAGISVLPTNISISEGMSAPFTITLDTQPTAPVTITLASSDAGACALSQAQVVLDANNYASGVAVMVTGVIDTDQNDENCTIQETSIVSDDAFYNGLLRGDNTVILIMVMVEDISATAIQLGTQMVSGQSNRLVILTLALLLVLLAGFLRRVNRTE